MGWIYLAASEDSLSPWRLGSDQSPTVKSIDTLKASCSIVCDRVISRWHQSATTYDSSSDQVCPSCRIYLQQDFPARTSRLLELEQAWTEADQAYFSKSFASLASFDPVTFSWKTLQLSLFGDSTAFSWSSLPWGTTVDGRLYQPQKWAPRTLDGDGSSLLPTLSASEYGTSNNGCPGDGREEYATKGKLSLFTMARRGLLPTLIARDHRSGKASAATHAKNSRPLSEQIGGLLNPTWAEWYMGFPLGWTELEAWVTRSFLFKREKRSRA